MKSSSRQTLTVTLSTLVLVVMSLTMGGCKAQQQMQQQIAEMDNRVKDIERRSRDLESELKKSNMELMQLRGVVKQVGDATVQLQKIEEDRQKNAAEAKSKAEASATAKKPMGKPGMKKPMPGKKKH